MHVRRRAIAVCVLGASVASCCILPAAASAQSEAHATVQSAGDADAVAQWIALPAATGHERRAMDIIAASLPGWTLDPSGNLISRKGSGTPRRVVACGLNEAAYVVSEITDDGYIRLHMDGRARRSPLWDQSHEGQRVRILTATGDRPAVVAVRSTHLWRARPSAEASRECRLALGRCRRPLACGGYSFGNRGPRPRDSRVAALAHGRHRSRPWGRRSRELRRGRSERAPGADER